MVLLCSIGAVEFLFADDLEIHYRILLMAIAPILFVFIGKSPFGWMRLIASSWHWRR
jgi:hypothetical protein